MAQNNLDFIKMRVSFNNQDFFSKINELFKQSLKSKSKNILWAN